MKKIKAPEVAAIKWIWWAQIEPVNFDWLPTHLYILDWSENFTPHTLEERGQIFQQVFIEFGHQMQKLQPFELDF